MEPAAGSQDQGALEIDSPHAIYTQHLIENRRVRAQQRRWDGLLGYAKLSLGALGLFFLIQFLHERRGIAGLLITIAVFAILAVLHEFVLVRIRRIDTLVAFYGRGLARLEDRWAGTGEAGEKFIDEAHPYARDLDLFGRGSLFELLCTFRTRAGEEKLAGWLLEPAPPEEVAIRQRAVQDLKDRTEFRENLFTAGNKVRLGLHPDSLAAWAVQDFPLQSRAVPILAPALGVLWVASIVFAEARNFYWPLLLISLINLALNRSWRKRLAGFIESSEAATEDLSLLCNALRAIEKEHFNSARLRDLQTSLQAGGTLASAAIRKLERRTRYLAHHRNFMIQAIDGFVFYIVLCAFWLESWRRKHGHAIPTWLAALGEIEALAALSCHAFEHPGDAWPEFAAGGALFEAESLAHPLMPEAQSVRNDVKLGNGLRLMVLSGPNMSGKSTFVRGIGINAVLAQCGAPVRAKSLKMSPLAVGASICILDSLQGGVSRFYAEIQRLKSISDLTRGRVPVLFLLDELLSGTNSHDRLEGSEMLVRTFVEHGAIGLITTHDLALARIPDTLNGRARNVHFADRLEDGKLRFDFKLEEGIVQTSNAIRLMKSIGLLEP
jgi:hypothetical protein